MNQVQESDSLLESVRTLEETPQFKVYFQRWLVLFAYFLFSLTNVLSPVQNAPILNLSKEYYNVSDGYIVWLTNVFNLTYILFGIGGIKPLEVRLDYSLYFGSFLSALGSIIKYLGDNNYMYALIGYTIVALGQILALSAPVYISEKWFPPHERTLSTSIGSFGQVIGSGVAFSLSALYFANVRSKEDNNYKQKNMNFYVSISCLVAFVLCLLFVRDRPPTSPSFSANETKHSIMKSLQKIYTKPKYLFDLLCLSIFLGISWSYVTVITPILSPYGYSQTTIGWIGLIYILFGTIGGTLASILIDRQIYRGEIPKYDFYIKLFITIGLAALVIQAITISYNNIYIIGLTSAFIGVGLNSYFPLALQSYVECLYPSFELVLITALMVAANLFGFIANYVLVIPMFERIGLWIVVIMLTPCYIYLMLGYETVLLRSNVEKQANISEVNTQE